ncbi:hypothetical protein AHAS_Ahas11G0250600 [Arachis hypogaea]
MRSRHHYSTKNKQITECLVDFMIPRDIPDLDSFVCFATINSFIDGQVDPYIDHLQAPTLLNVSNTSTFHGSSFFNCLLYSVQSMPTTQRTHHDQSSIDWTEYKRQLKNAEQWNVEVY